MREQPSKRAIELRVEWLNKALGRPLEPYRKEPDANGRRHNPGNFHIDHCLGGYRIEEISQGGGANPVFGHTRMNKRALCDWLEAVLVAIKLARGENDGGAWPREQKGPSIREVLEMSQATIERLQRHAPGSANGTLAVIKQALEI